MRKIVEYIPILTVYLVYLGFCNLYFYYKPFKIDIYNYINSSEILLSFIPVIILTMSVVYYVLYGSVVDKKNFESEGVRASRTKQLEGEINGEILKDSISKSKKEGRISKLLSKIRVFLTSPTAIIIIFLSITEGVIRQTLLKKWYDYQLQTYDIVVAGGFLLLILLLFYIYDKMFFIRKNLMMFSLFLVVYTGLVIGRHRGLDAKKIIRGLPDRHIGFLFNKNKVFTSKTLVYVGQTQNYLFLFDRKLHMTNIYKMESVDSLVIF